MKYFEYADPETRIAPKWAFKYEGHEITINNDHTITIDGKVAKGLTYSWYESFDKLIYRISKYINIISDQDNYSALVSIKNQLFDAPKNIKNSFNNIVRYFDKHWTITRTDDPEIDNYINNINNAHKRNNELISDKYADEIYNLLKDKSRNIILKRINQLKYIMNDKSQSELEILKAMKTLNKLENLL